MPGEIFIETLRRIQEHDVTLPDELNLYQQGMRQVDLNELTAAIEGFPEYKARLHRIVLDSDVFSRDDVQKNQFVSIYLEGYANLLSLSIRSTGTRNLEIQNCPQIKSVYVIGNPHLYRDHGKIHGVTIVACPRLLWNRGFINAALFPPEDAAAEAQQLAASPAVFESMLPETGSVLDKIIEEDDHADPDTKDWFPTKLLWDKERPDSTTDRTYSFTTGETTLTTMSEPNTPVSPYTPGMSIRPRSRTTDAAENRPRLMLS